MRPFRASTALLVLLACEDVQQAPFVQKSADAEPRWRIDINRVRDGVFLPYRPRCTAEVAIGHTVEFRNFLPEVPTNVTGLAGPATIYSPNLVRPYNFVAALDADNTVGEPYSYWRFTFTTPGTYDWVDTNQGEPGRKIVDPYYGTETFIGIDPSTPLGSICVAAEDGSGCDAVCCDDDDDCTGVTRCFKSELEAIGRCLTPSG